MTHPAHLKLELATRGVRLDPSVREAALALPRWGRRMVDLVLPGDLCVSARLADSSPLTLAEQDDRHVLVHQAAPGADVVRVDVRPVPVPRFYQRTTARGVPMWRVATVHGSHLIVHPSAVCGFSVHGSPCRFCVEGARTGGEDETATVAEVVEVVRAAFDEGACELVYFNTAFFDADDGGIGFLAPYIEAVRKHFDTLVATQVHPPRDLRWVDRTYAMGVDALSYNLEIFDKDALNRQCIGRVRYIGRERYLDALAHAAKIFPSGTVWCDLVLGAEPTASTMAGIDALAGMGVVPVASIPCATEPALDPAALAPVLAHLYRTVKERGINLGWVRDLTLAISPLEARHFAGADARLAVTVQQLTRSRLGGLAARGLARFRRRLRVRRVRESFDSAHL